MEFMEIIKQHELEEAFKILKELAPEVIEDKLLKSLMQLSPLAPRSFLKRPISTC
jgi:hypothetical protein